MDVPGGVVLVIARLQKHRQGADAEDQQQRDRHECDTEESTRRRRVHPTKRNLARDPNADLLQQHGDADADQGEDGEKIVDEPRLDQRARDQPANAGQGDQSERGAARVVADRPDEGSKQRGDRQKEGYGRARQVDEIETSAALLAAVEGGGRSLKHLAVKQCVGVVAAEAGPLEQIPGHSDGEHDEGSDQ